MALCVIMSSQWQRHKPGSTAFFYTETHTVSFSSHHKPWQSLTYTQAFFPKFLPRDIQVAMPHVL